MAVTTLDGLVAALIAPQPYLKVGATMKSAGVSHSHAYSTGLPGASVAPGSGLAGSALTTYAGQVPFTNPGSGNTYLARLTCRSTNIGTLVLYDRLWHNSGIVITTTTAQTVNSVAWPARSTDGTVNGLGVQVAIEASAAVGGGAVANTTLSYTNQAGTAGKTASMLSWPATANAGTFVPFQLAAGDTGVRSIQSVTLGTTYTSGTIHLVAYREIAQVNVMIAGGGASEDAVSLGMPRLFDNTVPFMLWLPSSVTATTVAGQVVYAQG